MTPPTRLSPLDAAFLEVETPTAHMHVGWAARFAAPQGRDRPDFEQLREHISARLPRAPRYRQRLKEVPLGISTPSWVDDGGFDIDRHVVRAGSDDLGDMTEECMSRQLPRDRPMWKIEIAERLRDGGIGVVGKAHHSMVDGIAAIELVSLLLDPEPDPPPPDPDGWQPDSEPGGAALLARTLAARTREQAAFAAGAIRTAASPRRIGEAVRHAGSTVTALADAVRPAPGSRALNPPITHHRRLGTVRRPLDELKRAGQAFGASVNDVVLAASAGAIRRQMAGLGTERTRLKAMVPANMRKEGKGELGNRISFVFCDLPCDEPDPVGRLRRVQEDMARRKTAGEPAGGDTLLRLAGRAAYPLHRVASRLIASPRAFNLVVSNIPGPPGEWYMDGCRLEEAYPVVPLADRHALSIGMTTVQGEAFFGLYVDPERFPGVDDLADHLGEEIDELLARAKRALQAVPEAGSRSRRLATPDPA